MPLIVNAYQPSAYMSSLRAIALTITSLPLHCYYLLAFLHRQCSSSPCHYSHCQLLHCWPLHYCLVILLNTSRYCCRRASSHCHYACQPIAATDFHMRARRACHTPSVIMLPHWLPPPSYTQAATTHTPFVTATYATHAVMAARSPVINGRCRFTRCRSGFVGGRRRSSPLNAGYCH